MNDFYTRSLAAICLGLALSACAGDDKDDPPASSSSGLDPEAGMQCGNTVEPFLASESAGLLETDTAKGVQVRLVSASAAPPRFGFNDWQLAISDTAGAPLASAQITWACAWMPAHSHGSNPRELVNLGNGRWEVNMQNLAMYGEWLVRFWISTDASKQAYQPQASTSVLGGEVCTPRDATDGRANIEFKICVPRDRD